MFYMIPLIKKCATMSPIHIQDTIKWWIKTNWRKRKELLVMDLRHELAFLKRELKERLWRNQLTIKAISQISAMTIHWLDIQILHNTEFTRSAFMICLLYFLILQFKIFSAFSSSVIYYNYLRPFTQHFERRLSWPLLVW